MYGHNSTSLVTVHKTLGLSLGTPIDLMFTIMCVIEQIKGHHHINTLIHPEHCSLSYLPNAARRLK